MKEVTSVKEHKDKQLEEAAKKVLSEMVIPVYVQFTPLGERVIRKVGDKEVIDPYEVLDYEGDALESLLHTAMENIFAGSTQIVDMEGRNVPLTRNECFTNLKISKQSLRKLIKKYLVSERLVSLKRTSNGKPERSQAVVYLTPLGRGYVTKFFDENYFEEMNNAESGDNLKTEDDSPEVQ